MLELRGDRGCRATWNRRRDQPAESLTVALGTRPTRDWKRRWALVQRDVARVAQPRTAELSGEAVHAAQQELQSLYIHTYHLKDALRVDEAAIGVSASSIEAAISADPDLALVADLANMDKHFTLTTTPRSGAVPVIGAVQGVRSGSGEGGWQLRVEIVHAGRLLDGLTVAVSAVTAWRRHLHDWVSSEGSQEHDDRQRADTVAMSQLGNVELTHHEVGKDRRRDESGTPRFPSWPESSSCVEMPAYQLVRAAV